MVEVAEIRSVPELASSQIQTLAPDPAPVANGPAIVQPQLADARARLLTVAADIVDKQYRLYSWNDSKALSLITTNSLLFAAVGFLFKDCLSDTLAFICISLAFAFLGGSLLYSLRQVIPQGSSGRSGSHPNLRSLRGILGFPNAVDYHNAFSAQTETQILEDATRQIYGMAYNNDVSRQITTKGVRFTFVGILFILAAAAAAALSAADINLLGKWAPEKVQLIRVVPTNGAPSAALPSPSGAISTPPTVAPSVSAPPSTGVILTPAAPTAPAPGSKTTP